MDEKLSPNSTLDGGKKAGNLDCSSARAHTAPNENACFYSTVQLVYVNGTGGATIVNREVHVSIDYPLTNNHGRPSSTT